MRCPVLPPSEAERLVALRHYGFADERPLPELEPVVRIAARMFDAKFALVNMIGHDHVFFAASTGIDEVDMSRDVSFCAHAILQQGVMVVPDARTDERFHDNPLVTGDDGIRFYAGIPLRSLDGHALGVLCVIDSKASRIFTAEDEARLVELARMAEDRLELRRIDVCASEAPLPENRPDPAAFGPPRTAGIDPLTGLDDRAQFYRKVEQALLHGTAAAVILVDLDGFKDINSILGPDLGDEILQLAAHRLRDGADADALAVARLGGDEFAVLAPLAQDAAALALAARLQEAIAIAVPLTGQEVRVTASCGVALSPAHTVEPVTLIGNADLALNQAKAGGAGGRAVYTPDLRSAAMERRVYCLDLHRAAARGEFVLFYQPQVRLADGALTGAEALIRWIHPTRGLLTPAAFLPQLEKGRLVGAVGTWVIDEACAQAARWMRSGAGDFRMAVNIFGAQFHAGDLVRDVSQALGRHGLAPEALELELTENIVLSGDDAVLEALHRLRAMGIGIAFDDFGTGYASLSMLTQYPLTRIKIDRSFVGRMLQSPREAAVAGAIIGIGRELGLSITAEGIETEDQRAHLAARRCAEGQGYLFGRPMPAGAFEAAFALEAPAERRASSG
ncbi:putative bifunctional diguanylate cyclase/phosphodiesterase [Xanthobacter tagetidis]|uniref:Sensor domain-containing phosphodiesterase n=1 Tax=Xanthobacter tagetidis TaxID=60216 RepID=A0A3L7A201_9HYPH|nr:sensor domain-containing phosphodiesterase [Xanthobacter tagetidis]MBB6307189.1 diguanylate cyclase (GGDEF)-like protein [Xanthobacter tagetidis]RLP74028.1 sensor domain-containing phosphodiesterase [Xanthobacter tagetidis]